MAHNVVEVRQVTKKYCRNLKKSLRYGVQDLFTELLARPARRPKLRAGEFFALRNVSFEVRPGECVAMLGPNGAGKSTMMKLLNGLLKPNAGEIRIQGKIGALIELGTGFNPQLTGRENVFINGAVLGMSRREIADRFDEILEFSELGDFIDAPLKTYSSGMRVRLGYSVAGHLRPNLLLLDEVLAVGDVGFRMKCFEHLARLRDSGVAIILVSHAIGALSRIADRAVVFGKGQLQFAGDLEPGIAMYQELVSSDKSTKQSETEPATERGAKIVAARTVNSSGDETKEFETGDDIHLEVIVEAKEKIDRPRLVLSLTSPVAGVVCAISSAAEDFELSIDEGTTRVVLSLPQTALLVGSFDFDVTLFGKENSDFYDQRRGSAAFRVIGPPLGQPGFGIRGILKLPHRWQMESVSKPTD